jgi:thioredoxin domain-containing protein 10
MYIYIYVTHFQDVYHNIAATFQPHAFFYQSHPVVVNKHAPIEKTPALFVYKESVHYNFTGDTNCCNS